MKKWLRHRGIDPTVLTVYLLALTYCVAIVLLLLMLHFGGVVTLVLVYWLTTLPSALMALITVFTWKTIASQLRVRKRQNQRERKDKVERSI